MEEENRGGVGWISAWGVAGGEGEGAWKHKGFEAHLLVCLKGAWSGRKRLVGDSVEHGGGGERRRGCSGNGSTARGGGKASRVQGGAN